MSTITAPAPAVKPAPKTRKRAAKPRPADTCRLFLTIRETVYRVARIRFDGCPEITHAYRLRKADDPAAYDVHVDGFGSHCTCGDHVHRHEGLDNTGCKHIRALRAW